MIKKLPKQRLDKYFQGVKNKKEMTEFFVAL